MIRRPATIISLGDYEVQCLLRQIFLRTLPVEFDQLCLDDRNKNYGGDTLNDFSDGRSTSLDSGSEFDFDTLPDSIPALSCVKNRARLYENTTSMASTAPPAAAMTASLHRTIDASEASVSTLPQISAALPRHRPSLPYGHQHERHSLSPRNQKRKENDPRSSTEAKAKTKDASQLSISQTYPSAPDAFAELTFSTVSHRGLPLASTESDEAVLTRKGSSTSAMGADWEFGTIQPDSIFEESYTDTPRV